MIKTYHDTTEYPLKGVLTETGEKRTFLDIVLFLLKLASLGVTIALLFDKGKPSCYAYLFLLPLFFFISLYAFPKLFDELFNNLALTIMLVLFFCRMVVSPMFLLLGGYKVTITKYIYQNTPNAIFLLVYEMIAVFCVLNILIERKQYTSAEKREEPSLKIQKPAHTQSTWQKDRAFVLFTLLVFLVVDVYLCCVSQVPEVLTSWRTVFDIRDPYFSHFEDGHLVDDYGTTFIRKFAVVSGTYLIRILTLLVPAYIIMVLARKRSKRNLVLSFLACLIPMFFIGGAIARSLLYTLFLFLYTNHSFQLKNMKKLTIIVMISGGAAVLGYWVIRGRGSNFFVDMSKRFSAYFSGVNVVSGVFNLPNNFADKLLYCVKDFVTAIPFSGTLFPMKGGSVSDFFNAHNNSAGQIPPTIAMGYYYFGGLLAPIYSVAFAWIAYRAGESLKEDNRERPFRYILSIFLVFYVSMGIIMYNIEILFGNLVSIWFPLWLLEWLAYADKPFLEKIKKKRGKKKEGR